MQFLENFKRNAEAFFEENTFLLWTLLLSIFTLGMILFGVLRIKSAMRKRKQKRAEIERSLEFALPSGENTFVRARLNTVLRIPDEKQAKREEVPLDEFPKLSHARELLAKVRASSLSSAERLETDELYKTLNVFLRKDTLTINDLQVLNDAFSRILKLSAKYAV